MSQPADLRVAAYDLPIFGVRDEISFAHEVSAKVCFLCDGSIHEEGPPEQIFGQPAHARTQAFLCSIRDAKRI